MMNNIQFPYISHLDDILPAIEHKPEFILGFRPGYSFIDYQYVDDETFDDDLSKECRGIKFCSKTGELLARPFHKFFNVGEVEETSLDRLALSGSHTLAEKLDGSMVHAIHLDTKVRLMTRKGITEVSEQAERHLTERFITHSKHLLESGYTPIFEWVSRDNKIVLDYEVDELVLLAIRNNYTGTYCTKDILSSFADYIGVRCVEFYTSNQDIRQLVQEIRGSKGIEGFVISTQTTIAKIKTDEYVQLHKAIDKSNSIKIERHLLKAVIEGYLDDLLPYLTDDEQNRVKAYRDSVFFAIEENCKRIRELCDKMKHLDQKAFSEQVKKELPAGLHLYAYKRKAGIEDIRELMIGFIKKHSDSPKMLEKCRDLITYHNMDEDNRG